MFIPPIVQVSYALNRALRLPARVSQPARLLCYTALAMAGLFCQWQVVLAWRRRENFLADQVVAQMDPSLLQAGLIYYDWRLRYNRFCYDRALDRELVKAKARGRSRPTPEYDPIQAYQDEQSAFQNEQSRAGQVHDRISQQSADSQAPILNDRDAISDDKTGKTEKKSFRCCFVNFFVAQSNVLKSFGPLLEIPKL